MVHNNHDNRSNNKSQTLRHCSFVILALTVLVAVSGGCIKDLSEDLASDKASGNEVTFYISVPQSALPSTRAIADGSADDNDVRNVTVLLFNKSTGLYSSAVVATSISTPDNTASYRKVFTVIVPDGDYQSLVLANADDILAALMANTPDPESEDMSYFEEGLTSQVIGGSNGSYTPWNSTSGTAGYKPFPMAAHFDIPANHTNLGTIQLTRMLAKINVAMHVTQPYAENTLAGVQISRLLLCNYNRAGTLVRPALTSGTQLSVFNGAQLNIPASPQPSAGVDNALDFSTKIKSTVSGTNSGTTVYDYQCVDEIFVPEVAAPAPAMGGSNGQAATCLLIQAKLPDTQELRWYRVNLCMKNPDSGTVEPMNIQRNFSYTVNITGRINYGFATPEEAYNTLSEGMTTTINAVDESDMNDITFDGRNQLTVNEQTFVFHSPGIDQELKINTDYPLGWELKISSAASWIHASIAVGAGGVTTSTVLSCDSYTGNAVRTGTVTITAGALRKVIDVLQVPAMPKITADAVPPQGFIPYVGAFWKANQTGERLIHIGRATAANAQRATDGNWVAIVLEGEDWIHLDTLMTTDQNVGWRTDITPIAPDNVDEGNDAGFDSKHAVSGNRMWVKGTLGADESLIYFRIGLNSYHTVSESTPVRYGVVLLAYNNYTKLQRIFVRQGEEADYVMRNEDAVTDANSLLVLTRRTECVRFSPYNLTAPSADKLNTTLAARGGVFTDYPTKAGALFLWATPTTAWAPIGAASGWTKTTTDGFWSTLSEENETCPTNYRRPNDGPIDSKTGEGNQANSSVSQSEIRQSLWTNPLAGNQSMSVANTVWGYYADGYFDRRKLETPNVSGGNANSAVALSDPYNVAYLGCLFFNPTTYASLFFPYAGNRSSDTAVSNNGIRGMVWTSSRPTITNQNGSPIYQAPWFVSIGSSYNGATVSNYAYMNNTSYSCNTIRCVRE